MKTESKRPTFQIYYHGENSRSGMPNRNAYLQTPYIPSAFEKSITDVFYRILGISPKKDE